MCRNPEKKRIATTTFWCRRRFEENLCTHFVILKGLHTCDDFFAIWRFGRLSAPHSKKKAETDLVKKCNRLGHDLVARRRAPTGSNARATVSRLLKRLTARALPLPSICSRCAHVSSKSNQNSWLDPKCGLEMLEDKKKSKNQNLHVQNTRSLSNWVVAGALGLKTKV